MSPSSVVRLVGLVDPLGMGAGFLIPVFTHHRSNSLLVETIGRDGLVAGYEPLSLQELKRLPPPVDEESTIGMPPYWAFGFGSGTPILGRGDDKKELLLEALEEAFLRERPMLGLEVAHFVSSNNYRLQFEALAFHKLQRRSREAAEQWRDIAVLTPDFRDLLTPALYRVSKPGTLGVSALARVVLRLLDEKIELKGLGAGAFVRFEHIIEPLALQMPTRHPTIVDLSVKWTVHASASEVTREYYDSPASAMVLIADEVNHLQTYDPKSGLQIFGARAASDFVKAAKRFSGPRFVLDTIEGAPDYSAPLKQIASVKPITLLQRRRQVEGVLDYERSILRGYQKPAILLAARTSSPFVRSRLSAEARDAMGVLSTAWPLSERKFSRPMVFFRARAERGSQGSGDDWAQIYERANRFGVSMAKGQAFVSHPDQHDPWPAIFFPNLATFDMWVGPQGEFPPASVLLEIEEFPTARLFEGHVKVVRSLLKERGWNLDRPVGGSSFESRYQVASSSGMEVAFRADRSRSSEYDLPHLLEYDLEEVRTIFATEQATPGAILAELQKSGELRATARDLLHLSDGGTIWNVIAAQVQRFANSLASRTRSHYLALICQAAFQRDRVNISHGSDLLSLIRSPELGDAFNLVCSRRRRNDEYGSVRVRVARNHPNRSWAMAPLVLSPFDLRFGSNGPSLERAETRA